MSRASAQALYVPVPTLSHVTAAAAVVIVLLQLRGEAIGEAAAATGLLIAAAIGWTADYRYLSALVILSLPMFGLSHETFPGMVQTVTVAGAGFAAPLAAMLAAGVRAIVEVGRSARHRVGWPSRLPVAAFAIALFVAGLGGLMGRSMGLNAWSEGVRAVLAVGGIFWGYTLARSSGDAADRLPGIIVWITIAGCLLFATTLLQGHFLFLLVGLAAAMLSYFARRRRPFAFGLAAVVATAGLALYTLTTAAIVVIVLGSLLLAGLPDGVVRRSFVRVVIAVLVLVSVVAIWAVLRFGEQLAIEMAVHTARSEGLVQYALFKLMSDRGSLWLAAMQQISSGPHWVVPAGRPLYPLLGLAAGSEWASGPHNTILQVLRNTGLIAGPALLWLMVASLFSASRVLANARHQLTRALAAAFIAVAASGIMTGDFPVSDVGFFLWALGGVTIGLFHAEKRVGVEEDMGDEAVGTPVPAVSTE
jgi:hypothetical protein